MNGRGYIPTCISDHIVSLGLLLEGHSDVPTEPRDSTPDLEGSYGKSPLIYRSSCNVVHLPLK